MMIMRTKCNDGNDNKSENINDSDTDDGGIAVGTKLLFGNGNDDDTGFDDQVGNHNSKPMKIGIRIT